MTIESEQDLAALKAVGQIVALTLQKMIQQAEPGITTEELDQIAKQQFDHYEAQSAPKFCYNFPGYTCISINEQAAHGIPSERALQPGDMVNIDVSAEKDGYFADTGASFFVPPGNALQKRLIHSTQKALEQAVRYARADKPLNGIGRTIYDVASKAGFKTIRNLCGHGVGRSLHEDPREIPSYFDPRDRRTLKEGQVIAVEPFLSTKSRIATEESDGWTLSTQSGNLSAQFEHTMVITKGKPILLTVAPQ